MADNKEALPVVAWRTRYRSEPGMVGFYPWAYTEHASRTQDARFESMALTDHATATAALSELRAEVERLRVYEKRWRALRWHWEGERDMAPGGRWWCSILCKDSPNSPEAAIDARSASPVGAAQGSAEGGA